MRSSTTSDTPGVEAIKWLAFALMFADHLARYALPQSGPVPWLLGRLVFPLFAVALGAALAYTKPTAALWRRLIAWGLLAQAALWLAAPGFLKLNVLFTFAAGVGLACGISSAVTALRPEHPKPGGFGGPAGLPILYGLSIAFLSVLASVPAEFGPPGALLVASAIWYGRAHVAKGFDALSTAALVLSALLVSAVNETLFGMLALPLAWAMLRWPVEVPRIKRLFYPGYVAQWIGVALVRVLT